LSVLHSEENFDSCDICKKPFSRRNILFEHTSSSNRETPYCEICVKSLSDKRRSMRRFRGRELSFSCNVCSKSFTSRTILDNQIGVHTGERIFRAKYVTKFSLRALPCGGISVFTVGNNIFRAKFVRNGSLKALSYRFVSEYTMENDHFRAKYVRNSFTQSSAMKRHLRVHSGG
jgi:stress-induced morphogen